MQQLVSASVFAIGLNQSQISQPSSF